MADRAEPARVAERAFPGIPAAAGIAVGTLALLPRRPARAEPSGNGGGERARLDRAVAEARGRLEEIAAGLDADAAAILEFQQALLDDDELVRLAVERLAEGATAEAAWSAALDRQVADYEATEDDYFRARAADLADLRDRVLDRLAGAAGPEPAVAEGSILVGEDLAPSRFLEVDWGRVRGAALLGGSAASHTALLARARGVPLLVGMRARPEELTASAPVILDAEAGRLIQHPSPGTRTTYDGRLADLSRRRRGEEEAAAAPAATADGQRVAVLVNVDDPRLLDGVDPARCDGVGLTRTEFLFHGPGLPGEEAQAAAYRALVAWAAGRPVTIRTLDAGGDKPIAGLTAEGEQNPFLGLRGVRLSLARPEVFTVQLRALARAAAAGPVKVMVPMVTRPQELDEVRARLAEAVAALRAEGIAAAMPPLGMMVEVPAAAIAIERFAADFLSIGSNDLVQYVTAAARDDAAVASVYDPLHPAVLTLIAGVAAHGRRAGIEVSLCGDMAADPRFLPALLAAGIRVLSVPPAAVGRVKAAVAAWRPAGGGEA